MKKKYLLIVSAIAIMSLASAGAALAYGGPGIGGMMPGMVAGNLDLDTMTQKWEEQMKSQANLLSIGLDELKNYWSQGKTMKDIIKEKGINETELQNKMKAARMEQQKQWLQTLVSKGQITQAQADARLKFVGDAAAKFQGKIKGAKHGRGMMGMGF